MFLARFPSQRTESVSPDTQTQEPAAEVAAESVSSAPPSAQPTAGESGRQEPDRAAIASGMDAFIRGTLGDPAATSKPADAAPPGESTPSGDVEAGGSPPRGPDGKFLPRRGAAEAVRSAEERIADLERQLAERDPDRLREQIQTEQATRAATDTEEAEARADASRYLQLRDVPDRDLSDEDYRWREDRKALLNSVPKVQRAYQAQLDQERATAQQAVEAERNGIRNYVAKQVQTRAAKYGIDPSKWGPGSGADFGSMADDIAEAIATPLRERVAELERELYAARVNGPNGLGSVRVPAMNGRSGGGTRTKTMDDFLRGT